MNFFKVKSHQHRNFVVMGSRQKSWRAAICRPPSFSLIIISWGSSFSSFDYSRIRRSRYYFGSKFLYRLLFINQKLSWSHLLLSMKQLLWQCKLHLTEPWISE